MNALHQRVVGRSAIAAGIAYPFFIYFGLNHLPLYVLALPLLCLALLRYLLEKSLANIVILLAIGLAVASSVVARSSTGLLLYPVLVNVALLAVFAYSIYKPPTVIETIAERMQGALPPTARIYTRKVTIAWCIFFVLNGSIALYTVFMGKQAWVLYNGFISYLLIGVMFAVEFLIRQRIIQTQH